MLDFSLIQFNDYSYGRVIKETISILYVLLILYKEKKAFGISSLSFICASERSKSENVVVNFAIGGSSIQ